MTLVNIDTIQSFLTDVVRRYDVTAPVVSRWADTLYTRLNEDIHSVWLVEMLTAQALFENDQWEHPNFAANRVYKLMTALGQDTQGLAGYQERVMEESSQTEQEEQVRCLTCQEKIEDKKQACEVRERDTNALVGYLHHTYECVGAFLRQQADNQKALHLLINTLMQAGVIYDLPFFVNANSNSCQ